MLRYVVLIRRLIANVTARLEWLPATLARLTVGWVFLTSGWGKLHALPKIVDYFRELGIPAPQLQAPFAAGTEFVCGALLLLGLVTRLASIPLIVVMVVAIATARKDDLAAIPDLFTFIEYLYIVLLVWLGVAGPGPLSLDRLLARRLFASEDAARGEPSMPRARIA